MDSWKFDSDSIAPSNSDSLHRGDTCTGVRGRWSRGHGANDTRLTHSVGGHCTVRKGVGRLSAIWPECEASLWSESRPQPSLWCPLQQRTENWHVLLCFCLLFYSQSRLEPSLPQPWDQPQLWPLPAAFSCPCCCPGFVLHAHGLQEVGAERGGAQPVKEREVCAVQYLQKETQTECLRSSHGCTKKEPKHFHYVQKEPKALTQKNREKEANHNDRASRDSPTTTCLCNQTP